MTTGYVRVYVPDHPEAARDGYALEHRFVLYEAGVRVPVGWHVHHLNGDKTDNRIENLSVVHASAHQRIHQAENGYVDNQYGRWPVV